MSPEEARLGLRDGGYDPIPLNGKVPVIKAWQKQQERTREEISLWSLTHPAAMNTGVQTRSMPTLDLDILDPDAADTVENLVRNRFGERGRILVRFGARPKRAILFRTIEPFAKIVVNFAVADGAPGEKLEFLGDGQQVAVDGVHPDTGRPYEWFGGSPVEIRHEDLPSIDADEAQALMNDIERLLVERFDYRLPSTGRLRGNGGAGDDREAGADWQALFDNIREGRAQDELVALINEEPSISILVLAAGTGQSGPGPLVSFLTGKLAARLRIPITIVPGGLTAEQIDALS